MNGLASRGSQANPQNRPEQEPNVSRRSHRLSPSSPISAAKRPLIPLIDKRGIFRSIGIIQNFRSTHSVGARRIEQYYRNEHFVTQLPRFLLLTRALLHNSLSLWWQTSGLP
jgi:hypothetical protein